MQNFVGKTKCIVGYMKVADGTALPLKFGALTNCEHAAINIFEQHVS